MKPTFLIKWNWKKALLPAVAFAVSYLGARGLFALLFDVYRMQYANSDEFGKGAIEAARIVFFCLAPFLFGISASGLVFGPLLCLLSIRYRTVRRNFFIFLISGVGLMAFALVGWQQIGWYSSSEGQSPSREGMGRAIDRAAPLLEALEKYKDQKGHYPISLDLLCPDILEALPSTGLAGAPEFRYYRGDPETYEIFVDCSPWIGFDEIQYRSDGNYIEKDTSARIGDWVFYKD